MGEQSVGVGVFRDISFMSDGMLSEKEDFSVMDMLQSFRELSQVVNYLPRPVSFHTPK
jgi:hypothetical protein